MLYAEWLPNCLVIGISYDEFQYMNPRKIKLYADAYKTKQNNALEESNYVAYIQGMYFAEAVASCLGKHQYPKQPYDLGIDKANNIPHELTEEEKKAQAEALFMRLRIMQGNFERSKRESKGE